MSLLVPGVESPGAQGPVLTSQEPTALGRLGLTVFERGHLRAAHCSNVFCIPYFRRR